MNKDRFNISLETENLIATLEAEKELLVKTLVEIRNLAYYDTKAEMPDRCMLDPFTVTNLCNDTLRIVSDKK